MPWWHAFAERDHEIQNPTSTDKIRLLGEHLRLGPESRVLDVASGTCGPAIVLASTFGCRVTAVERAPEFTMAARQRVDGAGLADLVEIHEADARSFAFDAGRFDVAMCLGATFVWDGLEGTLAALRPAIRPGGYLAVGECYWRRWPLPDGVDDVGFVPLAEICARPPPPASSSSH
jgi:SAM-dependent methyltransferase